MTLRYAHLTPDYLKSVVELMDGTEVQTATKSATPTAGVAEVVSLTY
jgi:hypothetical protein